MSNWIKIKDIVIDENTQQIHCDTRDFHAAISNDKPEKKTDIYKTICKYHKKEKYLINQENIKQLLLDIEKWSGGEGTWRMLNFDNINTKCGWFKYIRFYRVNDKQFLISDGYLPIEHKYITEENLQRKYLCFQ